MNGCIDGFGQVGGPEQRENGFIASGPSLYYIVAGDFLATRTCPCHDNATLLRLLKYFTSMMHLKAQVDVLDSHYH